jgi:anti-anti-sigma regulatory factor
MAPIEFPSGSVSCRRLAVLPGCEANGGVVWMRGGHDASTAVASCTIMARAMALDDADRVVDFSEVTAIDAATVGVIIRAEASLRERWPSLRLRSRSTRPRGVLVLCGRRDFVDPRSTDALGVRGRVGALGGWVMVPTTDRGDQGADASARRSRSASDSVLVGRVTAPRRVLSAGAHHGGEGRTASLAGRGRP